MKLDNFKKLLNKKAEDNPNLQLLIKYMRDEYLVDHVVESLNKMARSYSNKNANAAIMHFGTHMDPETEGNMIRDALSHHASHYKAALNSGDEKLADQHMKKIFQIMHMSEKLTRDGLTDHSGGKLKVEAIDPKPWERSGYSNVNDKGRFNTDTKGWSRASGNYSWLRGGPHESYGKETEAHGHKESYPLNQIKVNGKYLHIDDVEPTKEYVPHEFDTHPIMQHYKSSPSAHTAEKQNEYLAATDAFADNIDNYLDRLDTIPDYDTRGMNAPERIHKPLLNAEQSQAKLKEIMGDQYVPPKNEEQAQGQAQEQVQSTPASTEAPAPATAAEQQPKVIRKPKAAEGGGEVDDVQAKLKQIMGKDYIPPKPKG